MLTTIILRDHHIFACNSVSFNVNLFIRQIKSKPMIQ